MKTIGIRMVPLLVFVAAILALRPGLLAQTPKPAATPPAAPTALPAADDRAIRGVVAGYEEAWNAHDMKAIGKLFREDAQWVNIVGMHWRGRGEIMAAHSAFHETMFKNTSIKTDAVETRPIGPGLAIAVVTETVDAFTTPDGQVRPKAQDRLTVVLVKGPEGWKIAHGHNVVIDAVAARNNPVKADRK